MPRKRRPLPHPLSLIRAKVFAHTGRIEQAKVLAREAIALAETGDFLLAHADTVADLGVVLELAGRAGDSGGVCSRKPRRCTRTKG